MFEDGPRGNIVQCYFELLQLFPFVYGISQFQSDAGNMTEVEPFLQRAIDVLVSEKLNNEQRSIWLGPIFTYFVYQSACYVFYFPVFTFSYFSMSQ